MHSQRTAKQRSGFEDRSALVVFPARALGVQFPERDEWIVLGGRLGQESACFGPSRGGGSDCCLSGVADEALAAPLDQLRPNLLDLLDRTASGMDRRHRRQD